MLIIVGAQKSNFCVATEQHFNLFKYLESPVKSDVLSFTKWMPSNEQIIYCVNSSVGLFWQVFFICEICSSLAYLFIFWLLKYSSRTQTEFCKQDLGYFFNFIKWCSGQNKYKEPARLGLAYLEVVQMKSQTVTTFVGEVLHHSLNWWWLST